MTFPKMNLNILIIDDETDFHQNMEISFQQTCIFSHVTSKDEIPEGIEEARSNPGGLHLILLDLDLSGIGESTEGLTLIPELVKDYPTIPLIVVTNSSDITIVVEAMRRGAKDFLYKKDFDSKTWLEKFHKVVQEQKLKEANEQLEQENTELKEEVKRTKVEKKELENSPFSFIGQSPAVEEVKKFLIEVGKDPKYTVLLTGETGVGKEVAARFMYQHSNRSEAPFVAVNLSTINKSTLESMLFGHEKGAFTDAHRSRIGLFQEANGGILFLDEIGDIDAALQVKLLRFLEDHTIRKVGGDQDIQLDVQVITATNKNLTEEIKAGVFREDLYFRIKNFQVSIPPLRDRREDIPLIIAHYLPQISSGEAQEAFEEAAWDKLMHYNWPGNIRELKNTVESMELKQRLMGLSKVGLNCLPEEIRDFQPGPESEFADNQGQPLKQNQGNSKGVETSLNSTEEKVAFLELKEIDDALKKTYGQKSEAANLLESNLDKIAYRVRKHHKDFPELAKSFYYIGKYYSKIVK